LGSNDSLNDSFIIQAQKLCRGSPITTTITIKPAGVTIGSTNHLAITGANGHGTAGMSPKDQRVIRDQRFVEMLDPYQYERANPRTILNPIPRVVGL